MNTYKVIPFLVIVLALFWRCVPDRLPTSPQEITRPLFVSFAAEDTGAYAVPLRDPVTVTFNESMDLGSFPAHFSVSSDADVSEGSFSISDSVVTFTPTSDLLPATYYRVSISGGVKDANGNSLTLDPDWRAETWFYTAGNYSDGGFPHVFIADRSFDALYLMGNFNEYLNETAAVIQPRGMAFSPDGQRLLVVSRQATGKVYELNPADMSIVAEATVDVGPEAIAVAADKIFVCNTSARNISVLAYPGLSEIQKITFSDGFRPRDLIVHPTKNVVYVTSNLLTDPGTMKVISTADFSEIATISGVFSGQRSSRMAISEDGAWLVVQQERSDFIRFIDTGTNAVADSLVIPQPQNKDMDISGENLFVCNTAGCVYKYDVASRALLDSLVVPSPCEGLDVSPTGELVYVNTPLDSMVYVLDAKTLNRIRTTKVSNTMARLIVSPENY
ncbi:MAG: Ig-like domain-containing protein [Calditrichaeota bacterium]|nr:Ig-like domain-containing protein [Calditrichota bacterium]MCB0271023.1 Ig-like domain-containing protein [Calditrichota bacterium]